MNRWLLGHRSALLGMTASAFVLGIVAAILHPTLMPERAFGREQGSLRAPISDAAFADAWGRPGAPLAVAIPPPGGTDTPPPPAPTPPSPAPGAPVPPVDPPGPIADLLPDLPLPPWLCGLPVVSCGGNAAAGRGRAR